MTFFILFVSIIAILFLFINLVFAPHNPYQEKDSMFECGFHSFHQSRSPFNIAFFIYALVYLLLDLEILLTFPFAVSEYVNNIYGLIITLGFITIITIGFVYELGKGALKIPSKQQTYTIKNQPLIHISYIKNPFITSPLQSSIFPFAISIKNIRKYLTFNNIIIGLISMIVMGLVKTLGIPMYILNFFNLENVEFLHYMIIGTFGLFSRLTLKGLLEEIFLVDTYATMGGEYPTQGDTSGSKPGVATNTSDMDSPENASSTPKGGETLSDADRQTQEADQSSSTNSSIKKSVSERYTKIFDNMVKELSDEIKNLSASIEKAETEAEKGRLGELKDESLAQLQMVSKASADELEKTLAKNNSTVVKRELLSIDKEEDGNSKKRK